MQALQMPISEQPLHAMPSLMVQPRSMPCVYRAEMCGQIWYGLHHTADKCKLVNSLEDSVKQVSPDNIFSGVLVEWNDSQLYQERNRPHLQQFCLGDLKAVAQQHSYKDQGWQRLYNCSGGRMILLKMS